MQCAPKRREARRQVDRMQKLAARPRDLLTPAVATPDPLPPLAAAPCRGSSALPRVAASGCRQHAQSDQIRRCGNRWARLAAWQRRSTCSPTMATFHWQSGTPRRRPSRWSIRASSRRLPGAERVGRGAGSEHWALKAGQLASRPVVRSSHLAAIYIDSRKPGKSPRLWPGPAPSNLRLSTY